MDEESYEGLRSRMAEKLGAVAYKYDTDHNDDEWAECLELADAALSVLRENGVVLKPL